MNSDAEAVAQRLGEAGYAVDVETFSTRPSAEPWLAGYAGLSALAALLIYPLPLAAALLGLAAVVLHARDSDGRPLLARGSSPSSNVVGRSPHGRNPELVVVTSGRTRPERRRALELVLQTLMVAVPAGGAAAWVAEVETELPRSLATGGGAAAVALVVLSLVLYRPPADWPSPVDVLTPLVRPLRDQAVWLVVLGEGGI